MNPEDVSLGVSCYFIHRIYRHPQKQTQQQERLSKILEQQKNIMVCLHFVVFCQEGATILSFINSRQLLRTKEFSKMFNHPGITSGLFFQWF